MTSKKPYPNTNLKPHWKIVVVKTGEVIDTFRLRLTANQSLGRLQKYHLDKLEVQEIE